MTEADVLKKLELLPQLARLDDHAVFRDTFLALVEDVELRGHLVAMASLLYNTVLEFNPSTRGPAPGSAEWTISHSIFVRDLRAAADNLAYTRAFLNAEAASALASSITQEEGELAILAHRMTGKLEDVEVEIRAALQRVGAPP